MTKTSKWFHLTIAGALDLDVILSELRALRQGFNAMLNEVVSIEGSFKEV